VSGRTHGGEAWVMSGHGLDLARKWELDLGVVELFGGGTTAVFSRNLLHLDDLDGSGSGSVPGTHVAVALRNSSSSSQVTVLTVHVVGTRAGIVSYPDAKVLDSGWLLLVHLLAGNNFTHSLLDLLQTIQVVPKAGLGNHTIGSKDAHPVKGWHPELV